MTLESVLTAIENVEQSIASLRELLLKERAERDAFTAYLYQARRDYGVIVEHEGEEGLMRARFLSSSHKEVGGFGYKGGLGAWEHLLGLKPEEPEGGEPGFSALREAGTGGQIISLNWKCAA